MQSVTGTVERSTSHFLILARSNHSSLQEELQGLGDKATENQL